MLRAHSGAASVRRGKVGRPRDEVLAEIRDIVREVPGVKVNIGQPISHRLDHMMSGIRSQIAVKLYGRDIEELRDRGQDIAEMMVKVPGVVDLQIEPQVDIPQVRVTIRRREAARYGLAPADVAKALETALQGRTVSQVSKAAEVFDLVVWFDEQARNDIDAIRSTLISTPDGSAWPWGRWPTWSRPKAPTRSTAKTSAAGSCPVQRGRPRPGQRGPRHPERRPTRRSCRTPGRLLHRVRRPVRGQAGGEPAAAVARQLLDRRDLLLLFKCLDSWRAALQVMVNIPLAAIGSVIALLLVNWPSSEAVAAAIVVAVARASGSGHVPCRWPTGSASSRLTGIVCRNGIMMISHYIHLMQYEGEEFGEKMIIRGSLERLAPVLMTAMTAIIGLVPLGPGRRPDRQGDPSSAGDRGDRRPAQFDAPGSDRHAGLVLQVRPEGVREGRRGTR